ncbi:hypothetical protein [Pasteurella sp. PK-2025]|uniref:hypothetical protein n=1 Tax=Pasteurella sp. PK-2025 TaxID=3413133 RepID=UPI003C76D6DF
MKKEISELYGYLSQCNEFMDIKQLQFINIKILDLAGKYLDKVSNKKIHNIYAESKLFWEYLNNDLESLNNIKDKAWDLNDELFDDRLDSLDEILLRLLITTTYNDTEKSFWDQAVEFVELLIEQADEIGY